MKNLFSLPFRTSLINILLRIQTKWNRNDDKGHTKEQG